MLASVSKTVVATAPLQAVDDGLQSLIGHDGGDTGVATVCFFDPAADVGVVALANGNWRTVKGDALYLIMDRLFEAAPALG